MYLFLKLIREYPKVGVAILLIGMIASLFRAKDPMATARHEVESRTTAECLRAGQFTEAQCRCFGTGVAESATDSDLRMESSWEQRQSRVSAVMNRCLSAKPPAAPVVLAKCKVASEPPGASVTVDGKPVDGVTPTSVRLIVGRTNQVTAKLAGFKTAIQSYNPQSVTDCDVLRFALLPAREVEFISRPPGAAVFVDGVRAAGVTPLALQLEVTAHEVMFTLPTRSTVKRSLEAGTEKSTVLVELEPVAFVELTSAPEVAEVWVDGVKLSSLTPTVVEVPAGRSHFLTLAKEGFLPSTVTLAAMTLGDSTEKSVSLGRGGRAQLKTCANQSRAKANALEKKGASAEAAAKRAESEWCLAHE